MVHLFSTSKSKPSRRIEWSHFEDFKTRAQIILFVLFCLVFFLADAQVQYGSRRGTARKERKKRTAVTADERRLLNSRQKT